MPAFAQVDQTAAVGANAAGAGRLGGSRAGLHASTTRPYMMGSTTRPFAGQGRTGSTTAERIQSGQNRGDTLTNQRINSLNQLLSRVQGMKYLSVSEKSSLAASIQAEITDMTNLQSKINGDTSTTSLKDDIGSITKSYRVYALVEPQARISSASDRILNIVSMLGTVVTKIQTRLASDSTASANVTVQSDFTDITAKTADATTQANAAVAETSSLQPDNGNTTVAASNTAALKDARTKIQTAQKDLQAAEKDVQAIVKILVQEVKSIGNMGSSTGQ
jgi:hypothetical protein